MDMKSESTSEFRHLPDLEEVDRHRSTMSYIAGRYNLSLL